MLDVGQGCVRADDGVPRHRGGAVQLRIGQDTDVLVQGHGGIDPGGGRINDGHAGAHPGFHDAAVVLRSQRSELHAVVGALDLPAVLGDDGGNPAAGLARQPQDVGQVLLALRVVRGDVAQGVPQHCGVEGIDAGVDFPDPALGIGGVLVLADAGHCAVCGAEDAAIAGGVVEQCGEHRNRVAFGFVFGDEFGEHPAGQQRHVAVGHHDGAFEERVRVQRLKRDFDGTSRAGDLVLVDNQGFGVKLLEVGGHAVTLMPDNEGQLPRVDGARGEEGVPDHGTAADFVEDLGGTGLHPGTGTCS